MQQNQSYLSKVSVYCLLIFFLSICGCKNTTELEFESFLKKDSQSTNERIVVDAISPKVSLNLAEEFGILDAGSIRMGDQYIYIRDRPSLNKIYVLDKESLEHVRTISPGIGRGPGELTAIGNFSLSNDYVILSNETHAKIQIWSKEGEFIHEFLTENYFPHRVQMWNDKSITILSPRSMNSGHILFNFDNQGNFQNSFGNISDVEFNPIRFSGNILVHDDHFYFKGYSEHILSKWDKNGNLVFSVTTVDDIPEELNYVTFSGTEQQVFQYSPNAIFSSVGISIYQDYVVVVHRGDWNESPYKQYLDLYHKVNGHYVASLKLQYIAGTVELDDEHIYALHRINEEAHLVIYENDLNELLDVHTATRSNILLIEENDDVMEYTIGFYEFER
jgi:hypothetical protein